MYCVACQDIHPRGRERPDPGAELEGSLLKKGGWRGGGTVWQKLFVSRPLPRTLPSYFAFYPSFLFILPSSSSFPQKAGEVFFSEGGRCIFFSSTPFPLRARESCWWLGIRLRQESGEAPKVWRKRSLAIFGIGRAGIYTYPHEEKTNEFSCHARALDFAQKKVLLSSTFRL